MKCQMIINNGDFFNWSFVKDFFNQVDEVSMDN